MTKRKQSVKIPLTGISLREVLTVVEGTRGDRRYYGEAYVSLPFSGAKGIRAIEAVESLRAGR